MKKKVILNAAIIGGKIQVPAYFTDVAGLVVHKRLYEKIDKSWATRNDEWTISLFPSGYVVFNEFPYKKSAIYFANKFLAPYNWCFLTMEEVNNNLKQEDTNNIVSSFRNYRDLGFPIE